ncbi:MAG: flagellar biosynthetic protein FliO [Gammaproteobacteria bacterium]|nr:flagellar biosynthetic protein FliO [Gammaproteobacteria bacterium]
MAKDTIQTSAVLEQKDTGSEEVNPVSSEEQVSNQVSIQEKSSSYMKSPFINGQSSMITPKPIGFSDFFSAFIALIVVVMLIFFLAWLGKRSGFVTSSGRQIIKIVDSTSIGYKEKIALIEVGDEQVLIGITPSRIDKLMVLQHPVKLDEKNTQNFITKAKPSFINAFNQVKNKENVDKSDS